MTDAPKRICANDEKNGRLGWNYGTWTQGKRPADADAEWNGQEYILATPEALAASPEVQAMIAAAVEAERAAMRQWCGKRVGVVQRAWKRAAEKALRGDLGDIRNRVDMMDEPPMEIVQSAAAIRAGKECGEGFIE